MGLSVSTFDNRADNRNRHKPNTARFFDFDFDPELFGMYDGADEKSQISVPEFVSFPDFNTPFNGAPTEPFHGESFTGSANEVGCQNTKNDLKK